METLDAMLHVALHHVDTSSCASATRIHVRPSLLGEHSHCPFALEHEAEGSRSAPKPLQDRRCIMVLAANVEKESKTLPCSM